MLIRDMQIIVMLLSVLFSTAAAAGQKETDSVLAAVNGDPITLGEILPAVQERELQLRSAYAGRELEQKVLELRHKTVEELIDQKLIVADFHNSQLHIPPQEVEQELDRWGSYIGCHSRKDLEERVKKSGTTLSKLRQKILTRMIVRIMRQREFLLADPPAPGDIFKRFKGEEKKLSFPGSVELALLKLPVNDGKKVQEIQKALTKDPARWEHYASIYAITQGTDGSIGNIELDKLRPEFAKTLKKIKEQQIYPPVKTSDGIYFIKVLKYAAPRKAKFKEFAAQIKKEMENEIYRKSSAGYSRRLRDRAIIEYFFPVPEGVKKK